jgi:hypothetical protein
MLDTTIVARIFNLSVSLEIVPSRDDFSCERKRLFPKNFPVLNFPVSEIMLWLRLARAALYRGFPNPRPLGLPAPAGWETGDPAGWESCATTPATNPHIH